MRPVISQPILTKYFFYKDNIIPMATVKNEGISKKKKKQVFLFF